MEVIDMNNEIWRDIKGYEELYQVSNFGNVKSLSFRNNRSNKKRERIIGKNYSKRTKRLYVDLYKDGIRKHITIHRLVAEAFVPNPNGYQIINHIDGDATNNKASNLEWCTPSYNNLHAYKLGLSKPTTKPIIRNDGRTYMSTYEAARDMGISVSSVRDNLKGRTKTCKGYTFQYVVEQ